MATLTLRILSNAGDITKGSTLTSSELDQNLIALNNEKFQKSGDTITGNTTFSGAGLRILGDFSTTTHTDRVLFQTTGTNASTIVGAIPSGTGTISAYNVYSTSDPTNASLGQLSVSASTVTINSSITGTGSYVPVTINTGGAERVRINTTGTVSIGAGATTGSGLNLHSQNATWSTFISNLTAASYSTYYKGGTSTAVGYIGTDGGGIVGTGTGDNFGIRSEGELLLGAGGAIAARISTSGHLVPNATNTNDLGTTSLRWRNIYTQDLHLSNGIGDYTVVEGVENLYLVNNKTNKSFKFALIEVDPAEVPAKSQVA